MSSLCKCGHPKFIHYKSSELLTSVPGCHFIREPETGKTCGCGETYPGEDIDWSFVRFVDQQLTGTEDDDRMKP